MAVCVSIGCARPCATYRASSAPAVTRSARPSTPAAGSPARTVAPQGERDKIAVLPLDDDELFRAERLELRKVLAQALAQRLSQYDILPLDEVDTKLGSRAKTGAHCAFEAAPLARRATDAGWLSTSIMHILGSESEPERLSLEVGRERPELAFEVTWNAKLGPVERYRAAFVALTRADPVSGGLGLLTGNLLASKNAAMQGAFSVCEHHSFFDCTPESKAYLDQAAAFSRCFSGDDEASDELLFESGGRCEIAGLNDAGAAGGKRESCLCAALRSSAGTRAKAGRRQLMLHFEAPDLVGKPRPELRVVESTINLEANQDWHSTGRSDNRETNLSPVYRLTVDNLDAARAPLARCSARPGSVVIADLVVSESGAVERAHVIVSSSDERAASCIEKALTRAAFSCTSDGKRALLRLAVIWPGKPLPRHLATREAR